MRYNPLSLQERDGHTDFVFLRIEQGCDSSRFVRTFWTWWPLSVHPCLFLDTTERTRLSLTCTVLCLDAPEVAFGVTERREGISVSSWEVPSPRVAPWSAPTSEASDTSDNDAEAEVGQQPSG